MAHTVRITTTTTENTNVLVLNTGYMRTTAGLLKLAQLLLGIVTTALIASRFHQYAIVHESSTFLLLMAVAFLISTACLLLAIVVSWSTGSLIAKTLFEPIYHAVAAILLGAAAISLLVTLFKYRQWYQQTQLFNQYLAAAVIGLINAVLYVISTVLARRSYQGI